MINQQSHIIELLKTLPELPGVYQFINSKNEIIYIGKAKNLKKRVLSYFNKKTHDSFKSKVLVGKINDIKHIVVESESDALLLENNLIKKYKPRYNILLKDDKTFPWICIKNENYPRVILTRRFINDGSKYYGPYTSAFAARTLLNLIRKIYQLRTCNLRLTEKNISAGKFKVCLEYHIKNCLGPCEGLQTEKSYMQTIEQIHDILKGNLQGVILFLKEEMKRKAAEYQFEEAEKIKTKYLMLQSFQTKSTIVNPSINNVDVYSIVDDDNYAIVNYIKISQGAVIQSHNIEIQKRLKETTTEILIFVITDITERFNSDAKELILPINISQEMPWYKITVPKKGDKKKLLDLSERNARMYKTEREKRLLEVEKSYSTVNPSLVMLQQDLRMKELPIHIECFDNSNIQGSDPVAACVVFKNGKPAKKEYRHYNIKTVKGPDDFSSMKEVIYRRYSRLLEENINIPQLIIIDGGKGQLNAALKSLDILQLRNKIAIIGIAKRLEEIYFPDDPVPLYIDKNSLSLKLIQNLRNEAHRFGIEFHRLKRSKNMITSKVLNIPGIGQKSVEKLYKHFKSFEQLQKASLEDLQEVLDIAKARKILDYLYAEK